jgi:hypothetical protein
VVNRMAKPFGQGFEMFELCQHILDDEVGSGERLD